MEFAIILIWLGCVLTFTATKHQKLLSYRLSKSAVWSVFALIIVISWFFMAVDYPFISAGLMVLLCIMMMWIIVVLAHGHSKLKLLPFTAVGIVLSTALVQLGGM